MRTQCEKVAGEYRGGLHSDQSFTAIQASTGFVDIQMSDDSAAQGLGEIEIFNAGNSGPGQTPNACYLKPSLNCSGICFNNSLIENAIVKFNNNNIGGAASDWAPIWGVTVSTAVDLVVQKTMAHEVGHFFWLADIDAAANCTDPTIMSLDDGFYCAISNPTACDVSAVAGIYVGWSTVGGICSPCNTASSCN